MSSGRTPALICRSRLAATSEIGEVREGFSGEGPVAATAETPQLKPCTMKSESRRADGFPSAPTGRGNVAVIAGEPTRRVTACAGAGVALSGTLR